MPTAPESAIRALTTLVVFLATAVCLAAGQTRAQEPATDEPTAQAESPTRLDSLAEAARKARERRNNAGPRRVFTEEDLSGLRSNGISVVGQEEAPKAEEDAEAPATEDATEERGEAYWRGEARKLHEKIAEIDLQIDILREEIETAGGVGFDMRDAVSQSVAYVVDRNGRIARLQKERAGLVKELAELQEEGRKARALPGWFR